MFQSKIDAIALLGLGFTSISWFISFFFLAQRRLKNDGYFWLYAIIILIAIELGFKTFIHSRLFLNYPFLYSPGRIVNLVLYPFFLLFIWSITKSQPYPEKWQKYIIGFLLGYILYQLGKWIYLDEEIKIRALTLFYNDERPGPYNYWGNRGTLLKTVFVPMVFLSAICYYFIEFKRASSSKADKRLVFLLTTLILLYFTFTLFSNYLYQKLYQLTGFSMIEWPVDILFLCVVLLILNVLALLVNTGSTLFPEVKYSGSSLRNVSYEIILEDVIKLMEKDKLYLQKSLTIGNVAEVLSVNSKYISQVINYKKGMTFTQFVNTYRVNEAKERLLSNEAKLLTLEAIGQESGFKTRSTFFSVFKKITGETPSNFVRGSRK